MSGIIKTITGESGKDAARESRRAAEIAASGQREALDYLREQEEIPTQFREGALTRLAGIAGLPGGEGSQQELIDLAIESPLYQQLIGNQAFGEEAILRNQTATGGLRSGTTKRALSEYSTRLANEALTQSYEAQLDPIRGLAGLPSNANAIAAATAAPGQTTAQGIVAGAQARQQADQALTNNLFGLGGIGILKYSDIRLKENIEPAGTKNGHFWFTWDWSEKARELGLTGKGEGVMAHLVNEYMPEALTTENGHLMVNYETLGVL